MCAQIANYSISKQCVRAGRLSPTSLQVRDGCFPILQLPPHIHCGTLLDNWEKESLLYGAATETFHWRNELRDRCRQVNGYEVSTYCLESSRSNRKIRLNRLVEFGFSGQWHGSLVAHHMNHHRGDNRKQNLQPMTRSEHASHHRSCQNGDDDAISIG